MAVTITRTARIDDDGTGTTGTVINNAEKTSLYNEIDGALAKVAQLAGGNVFTGDQTIAGKLLVNGFGIHAFLAGGTGGNQLMVINTAAGPTNVAAISVGNDADPNLTILQAFSSSYAPSGAAVANGSMLMAGGAGGLSLVAAAAGAPLRCYTGSLERLRIDAAGVVMVNAISMPFVPRFGVVADGAANNITVLQNSNPSNTALFIVFANSASVVAGSIAQSGATTVTYGTASDARLKTDAGRATDLSGLRAVLVHDFTWHADGTRARGVFAQEAYEVFPQAIVKGTDDTTETGDLARPWQTDYSKFVPDLIVGWQQHDAALAELRAALATLKG